jgi:glycosyltransferase involved in cell wall biosynthesis
MKILYIITKSEVGGAQMHVRQLVEHMISRGHAVSVMSAPGGWLVDECAKLGVSFYTNPYFANSMNLVRLWKAKNVIKKTVRMIRPDIIHCHSTFAGILTRLVVRGKIPTIFTAHSWAFTDGAKPFRKIVAPIAEKIVARYTSKIICVSEFDRQLALRYYIASSDKLTTIYNGVALMPEVMRTPDTPVRIVSIGRLAYPKEYRLLIDAFAAVSSEATLTIVGNGPMYAALNTQIRSLELEQKVSILTDKKPEDISGVLATTDIFILLSKHEGFPMTILEAMTAGLPVVVSRVGGIPEAVDSTCGILVDNTQREVVNALETLINDTAKRVAMGAAGHQKVRQTFSLQRFLDTTEGVYREALSKRTS